MCPHRSGAATIALESPNWTSSGTSWTEMCGIAGVMMREGRPVDAAVMEQLQAALAHRGPDGTDSFVSGAVGLLNTRLAIIDLETGDQPLYDDRGAVLVAN